MKENYVNPIERREAANTPWNENQGLVGAQLPYGSVIGGYDPTLLDNLKKAARPEGKGWKFDEGKSRMDLLDSEFLEGVGRVLGFGANKYAAHNWRNGIDYSRLIGAALRHLAAINRGEDVDSESGLPHIHHVGCCVMFLSWMMKHRPDLDDRYKNANSNQTA